MPAVNAEYNTVRPGILLESESHEHWRSQVIDRLNLAGNQHTVIIPEAIVKTRSSRCWLSLLVEQQ
jgi:hypothetical protein